HGKELFSPFAFSTVLASDDCVTDCEKLPTPSLTMFSKVLPRSFSRLVSEWDMKFPAINEDTVSFDGAFQINVEEGVAGARGMEYVCEGTLSARSETMADCGSELDVLPATLPDKVVDKRAGCEG